MSAEPKTPPAPGGAHVQDVDVPVSAALSPSDAARSSVPPSAIVQLNVESEPHENEISANASPPSTPAVAVPASAAPSSLVVSDPAAPSPASSHNRSSSVSSSNSPRVVRPASQSPPAPSANPAFRRQLQSIRAADLESEHTLWTHAYAAEESFWLKQEERFNLLLKRAQVGATSSRDLHLYLKKSSKLLAGLSEQLQALGSFGQQGETGSMRGACMAVDIVRKTTSSYLGELNTRVFGESIRGAGLASEEAARLASTVESAGNDMVRQLKAQRRATNEAWMMYYKQGQERARAEQAGQKVKSDPFLLARQYEQELYQLQTTENKFQQLMASLLKDVQAEEVKRMAAMKLVLVDNLTAQRAVLEHSQKFTENALSTVKAINPEQDLQEFITAADLYLAPTTATSTSSSTTAAALESLQTSTASSSHASDSQNALAAHAQTEKAARELEAATPTVAFLAPPPQKDPHALARVYSHEIEKEGRLYRQGAVFRSNWKPMHAILSSSGFLHLFEDRKNRTVHSTWCIADGTVESGESAHPLAFALRFAKTGFSLSGSHTVVYFRAENSDELMEWMHHAAKYQQQGVLTTIPHTAKEEEAAAAVANGSPKP